MTTRQPTEVTGAFFSEKRAIEMGLAAVTVSIPPNHVSGELNRPMRLPPDPREEFTVVDPVRYDAHSAFVRDVNAELASRPPGEREIMFFVSGYNTTTSHSVLRLAQFVEDSGYKGVPVLFDWASAGSLRRYVYDLNSALIARSAMTDIQTILGKTHVEGVTMFGYSMGGLLVMEGLNEMALLGTLNRTGKLKGIILASPDIDMDLFRTQISRIGDLRKKLYVLISDDDGVLNMSRLLAGGVPRVGAANADELAELGVNVIDLSEVNDSSAGNHSKFSGSPEVVKLIGLGLNNNDRFDRGSRNNRLQDILDDLSIRVVLQ
ncbi:alpha/beta hydrolase [Pelagimonas varians]|nr:alpha/beta hydrolase [Pelagimonas varians]